eukprot:Em0751g2a
MSLVQTHQMQWICIFIGWTPNLPQCPQKSSKGYFAGPFTLSVAPEGLLLLCKESCDVAAEGPCALNSTMRSLLLSNCGGPMSLAGDLPQCFQLPSASTMDIVGPLPRSRSGNRYVLVICDYATRYPEAIPLRSIDAEHIAEELIRVFARVGVPREILTDQGSNFTSHYIGCYTFTQLGQVLPSSNRWLGGAFQ